MPRERSKKHLRSGPRINFFGHYSGSCLFSDKIKHLGDDLLLGKE